MRRSDFVAAGALAALAIFIWWHDSAWRESPGDTLPILAALPLFFWLNAPWRARAGSSFARTPFALGLILFPLGLLLNSTLFQAAGWTALLWSWLSTRFQLRAENAPRKLLLLPILAFPWLSSDLAQVGWWFRLSGATAAARVLAWAGFDVARDGTFLVVNGFRASVEAACAGLNGLQAMLVAGVIVAHLRLKHTPLFWANVPLLVAAAWLANITRITVAAAWAGSVPPATAQAWIGPFHLYLGWVALALVFLLCTALFGKQAELAARAGAWRRLPCLEAVLLTFALVMNGALVAGWHTAPYNRLGWLAFLVWLAPLAFRRDGTTWPVLKVMRPAVAGTGVLAIVIGQFGDLNLARQFGLAFMLIALAPRRAGWSWALCALSWLPAVGWLASRFGIPPELMAVCRLGASALGTFFFLYRAHPAAPELVKLYVHGSQSAS